MITNTKLIERNAGYFSMSICTTDEELKEFDVIEKTPENIKKLEEKFIKDRKEI